MTNHELFKAAHLEITNLHIKIENYFNNQLSGPTEAAVQEFFEHFSAAFTMVGINGKVMDFAGLRRWFPSTLGIKPGLIIKVKDFKNLYVHQELVIVEYKEIHTWGKEIISRISTAILVKSNEAESDKLVWLRLHETLCNEALTHLLG